MNSERAVPVQVCSACVVHGQNIIPAPPTTRSEKLKDCVVAYTVITTTI